MISDSPDAPRREMSPSAGGRSKAASTQITSPSCCAASAAASACATKLLPSPAFVLVTRTMRPDASPASPSADGCTAAPPWRSR